MKRRAPTLVAACCVFGGMLGCHRLLTPRPTWLGHPIDQMLRALGPPTARTPLADGGEVLVWRSQWMSTVPQFAIVGQWGIGQAIAGGTCTLVVGTDAAGVITDGHWDNCLRSPMPPPPSAQPAPP
jgi:hypothetical protein